MAKLAATFALPLPPRDPRTPAYRWLGTALRSEILEGRLRPGARLPATRDLAEQYAFSRGTIVAAFEQLKSEGYLEGSVGSGTYVNKVLPDDLLLVPRRGSASRQVERSHARALSKFARRAALFPDSAQHPARAFRANLPALELFPTTLWGQLAARRVRRAPASLLRGCEPMGWSPLREAVAEYLRASRGVSCTAEQVAIVSGIQEALDLVARLLLDSGDTVCMENPGYTGARRVFEAYGAKIDSVRVDDDGMRVPGARGRRARLAYLTPAHQFPLGMSMSLPRRLALLEWARSIGALIFEDDYDSEYRYAGRPVPALQGLDRDGVVLFAGSFSKVLFPSLRLGYLVLPPDLVERVAAIRSIINRHSPLLDQAVLSDFITEGHFGRHLRRMREIYAERRAVLLGGAQERLTGLLDITGIEAGLQTAGWLPRGIDAERVAAAGAARGVEVTPLGEYWSGRAGREGLQLGFAAVDAYELRRGVRELAIAIEGEMRKAKRRRAAAS